MSTHDAKPIESFEDFWPYYVGERKNPVNRALHYAGTTMAIATVLAAAVTRKPAWLLLTPIVGYGPAWVGHYFIEHNRPAALDYPLWSLRADLKMLMLALQGRMADEVERLHPDSASTSKSPSVSTATSTPVSAPASASSTASTSASHAN